VWPPGNFLRSEVGSSRFETPPFGRPQDLMTSRPLDLNLPRQLNVGWQSLHSQISNLKSEILLYAGHHSSTPAVSAPNF